jgi:hypothetical protein
MIIPRFRAEYPGEFIILETKWTKGRKEQRREWIPNPIENHHLSGRAAVIGSEIDRYKFDYALLQKHRGGLLGSKKLQTYGTGHIASQMRLDFTVESHIDKLKEIHETQYQESNIVYTTSRGCLAYPGEYYLTPLNPGYMDLVTIAYLAAFDGHNEVFLLGYNKHLGLDDDRWIVQLDELIKSYNTVKFYFVGEPTGFYPQWLENLNVETQTYRQFICHCDV